MKRGSISPAAWDQATTRREQGIVSSILHAEDDAPQWADRAFAHLVAFAAKFGDKPFTIEEFRIFATENGLDAPAELRAFGGVTQRALHRKVIERVGFAPTVSSNGARRALYQTTIYRNPISAPCPQLAHKQPSRV